MLVSVSTSVVEPGWDTKGVEDGDDTVVNNGDVVNMGVVVFVTNIGVEVKSDDMFVDIDVEGRFVEETGVVVTTSPSSDFVVVCRSDELASVSVIVVVLIVVSKSSLLSIVASVDWDGVSCCTIAVVVTCFDWSVASMLSS